MTSMRFSGIKNKLQKFSLSPSRDRQPKSPENDKKPEKPKKLNYKKKMKLRYNLSDEQYEDQKRDAQKQLKNWEEYRKERVLEIFHTKSQYVSKSKKSDVLHPKMARAKTVLNRQGEEVAAEFGRLREFYLYEVAPSKDFVWVRDLAAHDKQLHGLREKQRINFEKHKSKQHTKLQSQAEYEQLKSVYDAPANPRQVKSVPAEKKESGEETAPAEKFVANTTAKAQFFSEGWYHQSISRTKLQKGAMAYWAANKDDSDELSIDDDPNGKYTVTAEKMIETLTAGGKVKDSGVEEPASSNAKSVMTDPFSVVHSKYTKTCGRDTVFINTLKGTIDFMKKQHTTEKTNTTTTISQDEPTDAANQITFAPMITAHVFKGSRLKRQYSGKRNLVTFEESRKNYTREAGEETSGI